MEAHSIYAKLSMEPQDFQRWLESPAPMISEFDDWSGMHDSWEDSWKQYFPELSPLVVKDLLEGWKEDEYNQSPLFTNYDPERGEFVLFQALYDNNLINIAIGLARLRGAQAFCKAGSKSYVLVAPLIWDEGITALLEISDAGCSFLRDDTAPVDLMEAAETLLTEQLEAMPDVD